MEVLFIFILVLIMMAALGTGFPVGFALPGAGVIAIFIAALLGFIIEGNTHAYFINEGPAEWISVGINNFRGAYWDVNRDTLIAIPLFIYMGLVLQRSRIAEDLLNTMGQLFGSIPGGLGISVVLVGGLLAATTGIVGATVIAMGLISLPSMLKAKYNKNLATGIITASGTLGQIIPPSVVLIIVADQLSNASDIADNIRKTLYQGFNGESLMPGFLNVESTSAGEMFLGAIIPGLLLVFLYAAYVLIHAIFIKNSAPAIPNKKGFDKEFWIKVSSTLLPPVLLIFVVLGSILFGVATVNQAGAIGALGSTVMASYKLYPNKKHTYTPTIIATISSIGILILHFSLNLNIKNITNNYQLIGLAVSTIFVIALIISLVWSFWRVYKAEDILKYVTTETALTTTMVFIILIGAAMLTAAFRGFGGDEVITNFLKNLPGGFWTQFWVVMFIIFILGFFIDYIEIAVIVVPIIAPILLANPEANVTALWFGVMVGVNMQTSFLTPPFGFSLFYLRGVAPPSITTLDIWKGAVPFICLQLIGLFIACYWPALSNYVPTRSYLTSDLSPPPTNPRLERCLLDYTFNLYDKDGAKIKIAINDAKKINLDSLPQNKKEMLNDHFNKSLAALDLVKIVQEKKKILDDYSKDYYDIHSVARKNQSKILDINKKISEIEKDIKQSKNEKKISEMKEKIKNYNNEIIKLEKLIPKEFAEKNKKYKELYNDYRKSLNAYYNSVDDSYNNFKQIKKNLQDLEKVKAQQDNLKQSINDIKNNALDKGSKSLNEVMERLDKVSGTNEIKDLIYSVISDIQKGNVDRQASNQKLNEILNLFNKEINWREKPAKVLLPQLEKYDELIRDTIGIRQQDKLPNKQALSIAQCESNHHNISLHF